MKKMISALVILTALIPAALAAVSGADRAINPIYNLLPNPGFENRSAGWTASGGTVATTNSTASNGMGSLGYEWDSSAASQTLVSNVVTIPAGLHGRNGLAYCHVRVPSGSATHTITVDDGTNNIIAPTTIVSSSGFSRQPVNFIFPSSGSIRVKLTSVASNEPSIYVDDCYIGDAINLNSVSQATIYGTMTQAGSTSCLYTQNTSTGSNNWVALSTAGSCASSWTATGGVTAPAATDYKPTMNNMPPGEYEVTVVGLIGVTASQFCNFRINDGTSTFPMGSFAGYTASGGLTSVITGRVAYSNSANRTFTIEAADTVSGACGIYNDQAGLSLQWIIKRFPTSSEIAVRSENAWWKVDANISGANPSLGSANVTSYTGIENGSLTLTNNSGTGNVAAQIGCSSTNAPTGTTCSVGNESVSVAFTPLGSFPQDVLACVSFGMSVQAAPAGAIEDTFQIVETATNAQTIIQEGKTKVQSGFDNSSGSFVLSSPHRLCGNFTFTSGGQKMLRLMYETRVSGTIGSHVVLGDQAAAQGQRDIHWEVYPLNVARPATTYAGSVTSNSSGLERVERAYISNSGTPTITSQSGSWITGLTDNGTGDVTLNIASGIFSSAPTCVGMVIRPLANGAQIQHYAVPNSSAVRIYTMGSTGTATDFDFQVICMGPR